MLTIDTKMKYAWDCVHTPLGAIPPSNLDHKLRFITFWFEIMKCLDSEAEQLV